MIARIWTSLVLVTLAAPGLRAQEAGPGVDSLLAGLASPSWDERERSGQALLARWEEWTQPDLARIEATIRTEDREASRRAESILRRIVICRELGRPLVEIGADQVLLDGDENDRVRLLLDAPGTYPDGSDELRRLGDVSARTAFPTRLAEILERIGKLRLRAYEPLVRVGLAAPDPKARQAAVGAACSLGNPELGPSVAAALRDSDQGVRWEAARRIRVYKGFAPVIAVVLEILEGPDEGGRAAALHALAHLEAYEHLPAIAARLADPSPRVRSSAVQVIRDVEAREYGRQVAALLADPDLEIRVRAVEILGMWGRRDSAEAIASLLDSTEAKLREASLKALAGMRAVDRVPAIARRLADEDRSVRRAAIEALATLRAQRCADELCALLADPDSSIRGEAAKALATLGAREHADHIAKLLADDALALDAARALARLGATEHAAAIADRLPMDWPRGLRYFLESLGDLGVESTADRIVPLLAHEDASVRKATVEALDAVDRGAVGLLVTGYLQHPEVHTRLAAIETLVALGDRERAADVSRALADSEVEVRLAAMEALVELRAFDRAGAIAELIECPHAKVRQAAIAKLWDLFHESRDADLAGVFRGPAGLHEGRFREALAGHLERIAELLDSPDSEDRFRAVGLLGALGARDRLPRIESRLEDSEEPVRRWAARSLRTLDGSDDLLLALLKHDDEAIRMGAVVHQIARDGPPVAELPASLFVDPSTRVRDAVIALLVRRGSEDDVRAIIGLLRDPDPGIRRSAIAALADLEARKALPAIEDLRRDEDYRVASEAREAIVRLKGPGAAPELASILLDGGPGESHALEALGRWRHRGGLAAIERLLGHSNPGVRRAAARYAAQVGARERIGDLVRLLEDPDPGVASEAARALEALGAHREWLSAFVDWWPRRLERPEWNVDAPRPSLPRSLAPTAVEWLDSPYPSIRASAIQSLVTSGAWDARERILPLLKDPDLNVRSAACAAIAEMGVLDAAPGLIALLSCPEDRPAAIAALARLEVQEAAGPLERLLAKGRSVRASAEALSALDREECARVVARSVVNDLEYGRPAWEGVFALGDRRAVLEELGGHLTMRTFRELEDDPDILRWLAPEEDRAGLARLAAHPDRDATMLAAAGRLALGDDLAPLLSHPRWEVRLAALRSLDASEAIARVDEIRRILRDERIEPIRIAAIEALVRARRPAAIPDLERATGSANPDVVAAAILALARLGALPDLAARLEAPAIEPEVRRALLLAAGELGAVAVSGLVAAHLADFDESIRIAAVEGLGRMGATDRRTALAGRIEDVRPEVRAATVRALSRVGGAELSALLEHPDGRVRRAAVEGLASVGELGPIERALGDPYAPVRAAAARAYGRLGAPADLERIARLLEDPIASVRIEAALALGRVGGAVEATERLGALARDPDRRVARAARIALVRRGRRDPESLRDLARQVTAFGSSEDRARWSRELVEAVEDLDLDRTVSLEREVRSLEDLGRVLRATEIDFEPDERDRWRGRVAAGTRTTIRSLLASCDRAGSPALVAVVAEGGRLRLVEVERVIAAWR